MNYIVCIGFFVVMVSFDRVGILVSICGMPSFQ